MKFDTVDQLKQELDELRPLPAAAVRNLNEVYRVEWTYNSNAIEGNTLTLLETKLVLVEGLTIGGKKLREHFEVVNHSEAIYYVQDILQKGREAECLSFLCVSRRLIQTCCDIMGNKENCGMLTEGETMKEKVTFTSIDEYIAACLPEVQPTLQTLRQVIKEAAPEAKEKISYAMPTFELQGNLVHFAAFKKHIGFYPAPDGIHAFQDEVAEYHASKGTLQFPLDKPIPYELISRIVKYRVERNLEKAKGKKKGK